MSKVSYGSEDFSEGGSLYEGPAKIKNPRFGTSDYGGKATGEAVALLFDFEHQDAEGEMTEDSMILSVGKGFKPSEDGETPASEGPYICSEDEGKKLNKNCAAAMFLASLEKARGGTKFGSADDLDGMAVNLIRKPAPTPQKKDRQVYLVTEVDVDLPWEKKSGGKKKAKATVEVEAEEAPVTLKRKDLLVVMATVVETAGKKGVTVGELPKAIYTAIAKSHKSLAENRQAIAEACSEDVFLERENDVFAYDSDTGKITAA